MSDPEPTPAAEPDRSESQGGYLPKLPDGWRYDVRLVAPAGIAQEISVSPSPTTPGAWTARVKSDGVPKFLEADALTAAARIAANAAKSLTRIHTKEQELAAERAALFGGTEAGE